MLYFVSRPLFQCYISHIARVKGSTLSGIENCQLEVHTRHTKQLQTHGGVLSSVEYVLRLCFTCVALCCTFISHFVSLVRLLNTNSFRV